MGLAPSVRALAASRAVPRRTLWVVLPAGLGVLWLANRALASPTTYDFGLYHSLAIEYSQKFATIPGLGNLQDRLGAGNAHFLLAALFGHGPWAGAGFVLVNGLLVAFLFLDVAARFVVPAGERESRFARRMAVLLVPAAVLTAGIGAARLSEPDLDLATFVLVSVGALYLAEAVDRGLEPTAAVTSTAALAAASVTRPLYWVMTAMAVGSLILRARTVNATGAPRVARTALLVSAVPPPSGSPGSDVNRSSPAIRSSHFPSFTCPWTGACPPPTSTPWIAGHGRGRAGPARHPMRCWAHGLGSARGSATESRTSTSSSRRSSSGSRS